MGRKKTRYLSECRLNVLIGGTKINLIIRDRACIHLEKLDIHKVTCEVRHGTADEDVTVNNDVLESRPLCRTSIVDRHLIDYLFSYIHLAGGLIL